MKRNNRGFPKFSLSNLTNLDIVKKMKFCTDNNRVQNPDDENKASPVQIDQGGISWGSFSVALCLEGFGTIVTPGNIIKDIFCGSIS